MERAVVVWRPRSGGAVADALIAGRAQGEEIAVEKVTVGGFPVALTVTVDALTGPRDCPPGP